MSPNLRNDSKERCDDLKRRINELTVRVHMALHKYLDKPLLETLQDPLPLARDTTQSRLKAIPSSSSHTIPTPPPPTSIIHTDLSLNPYRPFSPPRHPPPNIPLPPIPPSKSSSDVAASLCLPKPPLPKHSGTARCIEAGNMAADAIDALPRGYRRIALIVFDERHPPIERIEAPPPPDERWALVVRGMKSVPRRKQRRRRQPLAVVQEEEIGDGENGN